MSFENDIKRTFNGTLFSEYNKYISKVTEPAVRMSEKIKEENSRVNVNEKEEELQK